MKMKTLVLAVALAATTVTGTVQAGMPVIDVSNLAQAIAQYTQMVKQLTELQAQLKQAKQQYEALTGSRGMGQLARTAENYVPKNWQETLSMMEGGGQIGQLTDQIRASASKLDSEYFENVDAAIKEGLDASMKNAAQGQALNATVYDASQDRQQRLIDLANEVDSAADLKAIADLQARIQIENAMLMNELIRLQSMNAMVDNQRRVGSQKALQQSREVINTTY